MRKILAVIAIVTALCTEGLIYPMTFKIVDIKDDLVTVRNFAGHEYQFTGAEDYEVDDYCTAIMWSNATQSVEDDAILSIRYARIDF